MDKIYLGQRLGKFEPGLEYLPYSRVDLLDENGDLLHTAGDDTGKTLEAVHPDATQAMADAILSSIRGFTYRPYSGQEALLDPAAELGDGITLGGIYSLLAYTDTSYDALCLSDVEAPETDEIDDEYPYKDPLERLIQRNIQSLRSFITKTSEAITLAVEDLDKQMGQTLRVAADGVTITNAAGDTLTIDGGQIDASSINTAQLDASKINASDLHLTGVLSWADFSNAAQDELLDETTQAAKDDITQTVIPDLDNRIKASKDRADDAYDLAWDAESLANNAVDIAGDAYELAEETSDEFASVKKVSGGRTYIDGSKIYSNSIYADAMHLGGSLTVYSSKTGTTVGGYLGYTTSANDGSAGMHMQKGNGEVVVTSNGAKLTYGGNANQVYVSADAAALVFGDGRVYCNETQVRLINNSAGIYLAGSGFYPTASGGVTLGTSSYKWGQGYSTASTFNTSDRNEKHDIEDLDRRYLDLFDLLRPVRYKFNDGTSGRYHVGFIAQEIEDVMALVGVDSQEFGGFGKDTHEETGEDIYMLRYEEFVALLAAKIQDMESRVRKLEEIA